MTTSPRAVAARRLVPYAGSDDYGAVTPQMAQAIGASPGPIRLCTGFGGEKGYGKLHVATNGKRMRQIKGLRFQTAEGFIHGIAQNFTRIFEADNGRFAIVQTKILPDQSHVECVAILEWDATHWHVVTAYLTGALRLGKQLF